MHKFAAAVNWQITGTIALSGRDKHPFNFKTCDFVKEPGWFRCGIGAQFLKKLLPVALPVPEDAGYIEFIAVDEGFQRRGIAQLMLRGVIQLRDSREYRLDLKDPACFKLPGYPEKICLAVTSNESGRIPAL